MQERPFFVDLERELAVTRQVLEAIPARHLAFKPHVKSMSLGDLAIHVAYLPDWMRSTLDRDTLDVTLAPRPPKMPFPATALLEEFDRGVASLRKTVAAFDVTTLNGNWSLAQGEQTIVTRPRDFVYRVWSFNHLIHHRGQLCLYLRLLDVPVPTVYFNTADEPEMKFA